jgi:ankyrin repeat protein
VASRTSLDDLLDAIARDEAGALRLIRRAPQLANERVATERFIEEVPHQVYVGDTALHVAAAAVAPEVVQALLGAGADPNAENRRGAIPLHYACDPRPNSGRARDGQRKVIELLLEAGARIDHVEKAGAAPIHRAVRARSPEAVRCLLERGASVHARHGKQGSTPMQLAHHSTGAGGTKGARAEQEEIVELLLRYGAERA